MKKKIVRRLASGIVSLVLLISVSINACAIPAFFEDVKTPEFEYLNGKADWYSRAVYYLDYAHCLTSADDEGCLYKPNSGITREDFLLFLGLFASECGNKENGIIIYEEDSYDKAIQWALDNHILYGRGGDPAGKEYLTRQEMVVFLMRFADYMEIELKEQNAVSEYADSDTVISWAKESMKEACGFGLVSGIRTGNGNICLRPRRIATRAEAAQVIYNYAKAADIKIPTYAGDVADMDPPVQYD